MMEFLSQVTIMVVSVVYLYIQLVAGVSIDSMFSHCNRMTDPQSDDYVTVQLETVSVENGVTTTVPFVCKKVRIHTEDVEPVGSYRRWRNVTERTKTNEEGKLFLKKDYLVSDKGHLFHGEGNYNRILDAGSISEEETTPIVVPLKYEERCDSQEPYPSRIDFCD